MRVLVGCSRTPRRATKTARARRAARAREKVVSAVGRTEYVVSYSPLGRDRRGRRICEQMTVPAFVDHSCRREPDLELEYPSISALCRRGKFAPKLKSGDRVAFICHRATGEWFLTAFLEVVETFDSHRAARRWYVSRGLPVPRNCLVPGNDPLPLTVTNPIDPGLRKRWLATRPDQARIQADWDQIYWSRARDFPQFRACRVLRRELETPPIVTTRDMQRHLGRVPGTQNPRAFSSNEVTALVEALWPE